jgi:hypothetical protein
MTDQTEMPKYKCHKEVRALQIQKITLGYDAEQNRYTLYFSEPGFAPIDIGEDWWEHHKPVAGGYYVVYNDGYKSFSPKEAFEEGYTRIT